MTTPVDGWVLNWMRVLHCYAGDWIIFKEEASRIGRLRYCGSPITHNDNNFQGK
jgi:hypothetical protein